MRVEMVADNVQSLCPVIHASEIRGMNPFFPQSRGISLGIEAGRPLQKPQDVNAFAGVFHRPLGDGFKRKRTDLNLDGNRHSVNFRANIGAIRSERAFQHDIADMGFLLERHENLHFAAPVFVAFIFGIQARKGVDVSKMIDRASAGFQNDFIAAIRTFERAMRFGRQICGDDFAGEFSFGAEHGEYAPFYHDVRKSDECQNRGMRAVKHLCFGAYANEVPLW